MKIPTKRYILWLSNGEGCYSPIEYNELEEAMIADKYSPDWYVTESINYLSISGYYKKPSLTPQGGNQ